ncbi:MAG: hypothetical protein QXK37_01525 [Candidatus Woesearchaeota archaeon]
MLKKRHGQVWYQDFIIAIVIFSISMAFIFSFIPNIREQKLKKIEEVYNDARSISGGLMTEGYPPDWTNTTVRRIGLFKSDYVLDKSKADRFANLTNSSYYKSKFLFGSRSDFAVFFKSPDGRLRKIGSQYYIGHWSVEVKTNADEKFFGYYAMPASLLHTKMPILEARTGINVVSYTSPDELVTNINSLDAALIENPRFSPAQVSIIEDYVRTGHFIFLSGNVSQTDGQFLNVTYIAGDLGTFNSTVVSSDNYLDFNPNDIISYNHNSTVLGNRTQYFETIAKSGETSTIAKWVYGKGQVYYFSSFDAVYSGEYGEYQDYIEEAVEQHFNDVVINASLDFSKVNSSSLVSLQRVMLYNRQPIIMVVYAWR